MGGKTDAQNMQSVSVKWSDIEGAENTLASWPRANGRSN